MRRKKPARRKGKTRKRKVGDQCSSLSRGKAARPRPKDPRPRNRRKDSSLNTPTLFIPTTYAERNVLLLALGYRDYWAYLQSPLWLLLRRQAYKLHGRKCKLCQYKASHIHHLDYSVPTLLGHDLKHLVPLCRKCHDQIERGADGGKRTLKEAQKEYRRLLRASKRKPR